MNSSILSKIDRSKRNFDMTSKKDLEVVRNFMKTNSWGAPGCPFVLEFPYLSVPDMIKDKLARRFLGVSTNA